jgi:hypothetical protein
MARKSSKKLEDVQSKEELVKKIKAEDPKQEKYDHLLEFYLYKFDLT